MPFGEEILPVLDDSTKMFTGHEPDRKTGLDYMLARYYEAGAARFVSVDPSRRSVDLFTPLTLNRYSYARNNPMNRIDPDGQADVKSEIASSAFGMLPVAGEFQDATIALTGYDPITSEKQGVGTRIVAGGAFFIPFVGGKAISNMATALANKVKKLVRRGAEPVLSSRPVLDRALKGALAADNQADAVRAFEGALSSKEAVESGFTAGKMTARDGSVIFVAAKAEDTVVINKNGEVFRGGAFEDGDQFTFMSDGSVQVNQENLKSVRLEKE